MAIREHHYVVVGRIDDDGQIKLYLDSDTTQARFEEWIYDYGREESEGDGWVPSADVSEEQRADDMRIEGLLRDLLDADGDA